MQKNLCLGLGVVLFCVAAVLYFSGNSDSDFRLVSKAEALTVQGGGYSGFAAAGSSTCGPTDGSTPVGCNGTTLMFAGTGQLKPASSQHCGGNCGNHWTIAIDGGE
ncbi:MAG: hypothetical protein LBQ50_05390 [Planctomycetaceae bacterium]|jgi:hypothetical protein|nr:hypothetical protein [Planctomycetaceae bacterium]